MTERAEITAVARGAKRTGNTRCEINIRQKRKVSEVGMDREKVIKAIECCVVNHTRCFDDNDKLCPYFSTKVYMCEIELLKDALALLKDQQQQIWELQDQVEYLTDKLKEQEAVELCDRCGRRRLKSNREVK